MLDVGPAGHHLPGRPTGHSVAHALSGRRLVVATALALLVPTVLGITALQYQRPDPPPPDVGPSFEVLAQVPNPASRSALGSGRVAHRLALKLSAPALLDPVLTRAAEPVSLPTLALTGAAVPDALPTLALAVRARPYSLRELRTSEPAAFAGLDGGPANDGPVVLNANLLVPVGAALVIDGRTPDVRLRSSAGGFATIISRGTVTVSGTAARPVRISSWDPAARAVDRDTSDGRSFVLQSGGRMDVRHGVFESLGFDVGVTSGVAWSGTGGRGTAREPVEARGNVSDSTFLNNHFGAYTRVADGMRWRGNTFAGNDEYGFDPHDFSNNFVVEGNTAFGNGKHGFIFSRGCGNNVLRHNVAHDNAGHGFMIDDGRSTPTGDAKMRVDGSNGNLVVENYAFANNGNGVEIEGGTGNVVANNRLLGNYVGVRIKDEASVTVRANSLRNNLRYGIDVRNSGGSIQVTDNVIAGSWGAVNLATRGTAVLDGNVTSGVSADLVVEGTAIRDTSWTERLGAFLHWNPLLLLWSLVLGVPVLVAILRLVSGRTRAGRLRIPAG